MKKIYAAVNLDGAEFAKEEFREKWDKKYPGIMKSWDKNWPELTTFFEFPQEIRKLIYTTNAIESYHRVVRKFSKSKAIFSTDDALRKVIYTERTGNLQKVDDAGQRLGLSLPAICHFL